LLELESPSWWPFGKLPWKCQQEAKAEDAARAAAAAAGKGSGRTTVIVSIPAVVTRGGDSDLKPGCLTVLVSSLEARDANCQLLHRFERNEIDEIRVHSPYEIAVRQRFIGKPDICYRFLSAKMPEAMSVLDMQYKKKVNFTSEYAAFKATPVSSPCDTEGPSWNEGKAWVISINRDTSLFPCRVCKWPLSGSKALCFHLLYIYVQPHVKTSHPHAFWGSGFWCLSLTDIPC